MGHIDAAWARGVQNYFAEAQQDRTNEKIDRLRQESLWYITRLEEEITHLKERISELENSGYKPKSAFKKTKDKNG